MFRKLFSKIYFAYMFAVMLWCIHMLCSLIGDIGKWILSTTQNDPHKI